MDTIGRGLGVEKQYVALGASDDREALGSGFEAVVAALEDYPAMLTAAEAAAAVLELNYDRSLGWRVVHSDGGQTVVVRKCSISILDHDSISV